MFKPVFQKMRKGFRFSASNGLALSDAEFDEETNMGNTVPDDVEEGYFTVFAVQGLETQRFVVKIDILRNPAFLSLLEQAQEEFGFQQKGALSLPCQPRELQQILEDSYPRNADTGR